MFCLPPLGKLAAVLLVLGTPDVQVVQTLRGHLALGPEQILDTFVDLR